MTEQFGQAQARHGLITVIPVPAWTEERVVPGLLPQHGALAWHDPINSRFAKVPS
jgi:hypothetical protein